MEGNQLGNLTLIHYRANMMHIATNCRFMCRCTDNIQGIKPLKYKENKTT